MSHFMASLPDVLGISALAEDTRRMGELESALPPRPSSFFAEGFTKGFMLKISEIRRSAFGDWAGEGLAGARVPLSLAT